MGQIKPFVAGPVQMVAQSGMAEQNTALASGAGGLVTAAKHLDTFTNQMIIREERKSMALADQSYMDARNHWIEAQGVARESAKAGGEGHIDTFKTGYKTDMEARVNADGLTATAKAHLNKKLSGLYGTLMDGAIKFEAKKTAELESAVLTGTLTSSVNLARKDPYNMLMTALADGEEAILNSRLDETAKIAEIEKFRSDTLYGATLTVIENDPDEALRMLDRKQFKDTLSADKYSRAKKSALSRKAAMAGEAVAAQNKADSDYRHQIGLVNAIYESGRVPTELQQALLTDAREASNHPELLRLHDDLISFSPTLNSMASMSAQRLEVFVDSLPGAGEEATSLQVTTIKAGQALLKQKRSAANKGLRDMTAALNDVIEVNGALRPIDVEVLNQLIANADDADALRNAAALQAKASIATGTSGKSLAWVEAAVNELSQHVNSDGTVSPTEASQLSAAMALRDNMRSALKTQGGLGWADSRAPIAPLDSGTVSGILARFADSKGAEIQYGAAKPQFFLVGDIEAEKEKMRTMSAIDRASHLARYSEALGDDAAEVFHELASRGEYRMAWVGRMMTSNDRQFQKTAIDIELGAQRIEQGGTKVLPTNIETAVTTYLQHSLNNDTAARQGVVEAVTALWAARNKQYDSDAGETEIGKLVTEVMGSKLSEMNGAAFIPPIGVENGDDFKGRVQYLSQEDLVAAFGGVVLDAQGAPITPMSIADSGQFEYAASGKYFIRNTATGRVLSGPDGMAAVFNWNAIGR